MNEKHEVIFTTDGVEPRIWIITVDSAEVTQVRESQMDIADNNLKPLWEALGVTIRFVEGDDE